MKKTLTVILALLVLLAFFGCDNKEQMEKKLLEYQTYYAEDTHDETHVTFNEDHTYVLSVAAYNKEAGEFSGTWSHVLTFDYSHKVSSGCPNGCLPGCNGITTTESRTVSVFKLEGATDGGKQYYFCFRGYFGDLYATNEKITKEHFEQFRQDADKDKYISIPGTAMRGDGSWRSR